MNTEQNTLDFYLDAIGQRPLLTDEQERELSARILAGDQKAVGKLAEANLRFVVKTAAQYRGQGLPLEDLISEGNVGLMEAAAKFDASHGTRFVNYAVGHIRRQIEKAIGQAAPKHEAQAPITHTSVDAPLGYRNNLSLLSILVNHDAPMADERVHHTAIEQAVEQAFATLPPREAEIINKYYGLYGDHATMAEIAQDMGLKRERIRQIRNHAIRRFRKAYRNSLAKLV